MTARLPVPGGDDGDWGSILNTFLEVSLNSDGSLNTDAVGMALSSQLSTPIPTDNLGTGTPSNSNFLRGDGTWAVPSSSSEDLSAIANANPTAGNVSMNSHKLTSLANGTAAADAAAFGQLPSSGSPLPISQGGTGVNASSNAALLTDLGAAQLAGSAFTGYVAPGVVSLTFGTNISVNASLGNVFAVTLTASSGTIENPTSPTDGQLLRLRIFQDGTGSRTVAWGSAYDWGTTNGTANSAPTLTTTASKADILAFEYVAALTKWVYLGTAFPQGF